MIKIQICRRSYHILKTSTERRMEDCMEWRFSNLLGSENCLRKKFAEIPNSTYFRQFSGPVEAMGWRPIVDSFFILRLSFFDHFDPTKLKSHHSILLPQIVSVKRAATFYKSSFFFISRMKGNSSDHFEQRTLFLNVLNTNNDTFLGPQTRNNENTLRSLISIPPFMLQSC